MRNHSNIRQLLCSRRLSFHPLSHSQWYYLVIMASAVVLLVITSFTVKAASLPLSANLQAVLLAKILMYEKTYKNSSGVSVYVVNAPPISEAFSKLIGESTDHIGIKTVLSGDNLPEERYDLIYLNDLSLVAEAKKYASKHRSVLVTGKKQLVEEGITLGTSAENGRPKFYLNLTASFSADLDWEPKVLSIVGTFR